jgi:hypothetical protein
MRMRIVLPRLLLVGLAASFGATAQDMRPNKDPVPSPSDLRSASGEDRPQGQAREARTPSPSELAVERPRVDGDRATSAIQDPRNSGAGASAPALAPSELPGSGSGSQFR